MILHTTDDSGCGYGRGDGDGAGDGYGSVRGSGNGYGYGGAGDGYGNGYDYGYFVDGDGDGCGDEGDEGGVWQAPTGVSQLYLLAAMVNGGTLMPDVQELTKENDDEREENP